MLLIAATSLTYAQFSFGVRAGVNIAKEKFTNTGMFSNSSKTGFNGGLAAKYMFAPKFGAAINFSYSTEGTKEKYTGTPVTTGTIYETYFNIPLMFQYLPVSNIYVEAGPQLGFLSSSKETFGTSTKNDIKKYYNSTDFRYCVGAGYLFTKQVPGLGLGARYNASFSKINKTSVGGGELKNQVFSIDVSYFISPKMFKKH